MDLLEFSFIEDVVNPQMPSICISRTYSIDDLVKSVPFLDLPMIGHEEGKKMERRGNQVAYFLHIRVVLANATANVIINDRCIIVCNVNNCM